MKMTSLKSNEINTSKVLNAFKIAYIFGAGVGVFFINNIYILLGVIFIHFLAFLLIKNEAKNFKFLYKVRWFIFFFFLFDAFVGNNDIDLFKIKKWTISLSYDGLLSATLMSCKLISMLLITQVIRLTMSGKEFVSGMTTLGLGRSSAEIIDEILIILSNEKISNSGSKGERIPGNGGGNGSGGGRNKSNENAETRIESEASEGENVAAKDVLFRGRVGNIPKKLLNRIHFAKDQFTDNPNAVIASSSLAVTLIRMVKIAPGLPLAPGHKNILFFPVFIHGILKSKRKFAGAQIGIISGILHFTMGFGKYGPLGIIEFAILGWVFDVLLKLPVNKNKLWFLMVLGGIGGLIRISTEMLILLVLGMPEAFYIIYFPYVIAQVAFGIASGFITKSILTE